MFAPKPPWNASDWRKELHPSWRRYTLKYRKKKRIVKDVWICSGLLMLNASLSVVIALFLATSFLSFMILDETP